MELLAHYLTSSATVRMTAGGSGVLLAFQWHVRGAERHTQTQHANIMRSKQLQCGIAALHNNYQQNIWHFCKSTLHMCSSSAKLLFVFEAVSGCYNWFKLYCEGCVEAKQTVDGSRRIRHFVSPIAPIMFKNECSVKRKIWLHIHLWWKRICTTNLPSSGSVSVH